MLRRQNAAEVSADLVDDSDNADLMTDDEFNATVEIMLTLLALTR